MSFTDRDQSPGLNQNLSKLVGREDFLFRLHLLVFLGPSVTSGQQLVSFVEGLLLPRRMCPKTQQLFK